MAHPTMAKMTSKMLLRLTSLLVLASVTTAGAAPNIPSSELPGRERDRFQGSPIDRFTQPGTPTTKPVWRWDCQRSKSKGGRRAARKGC